MSRVEDVLREWEALAALRAVVEEEMRELVKPLERAAAALHGQGPYAVLDRVDSDGRVRFTVRGLGQRTFAVSQLEAVIRMHAMTESSIPPNAPGESIAPGAAEPGGPGERPGQAVPESERQQEVAEQEARRQEGDEGPAEAESPDVRRQEAGEEPDPE